MKKEKLKRLLSSPAQTKVRYETAVFQSGDTASLVGKKMTAVLAPMDPIQGSEPGAGVQGGLMTAFKNTGYKRMIRGHLLNAHLGGMGIAANLFPITSQANGLHKTHVENYVKNRLWAAHLDENHPAVNYSVEVESAFNLDDPAATLNCNVDGKEIKIESKPETSARNITRNEGVASNGDTKSSFRNAQLPGDWGRDDRNLVNQRSANHSQFHNPEGQRVNPQEEDVGQVLTCGNFTPTADMEDTLREQVHLMFDDQLDQMEGIDENTLDDSVDEFIEQVKAGAIQIFDESDPDSLLVPFSEWFSQHL